ncbi:metallophosphoesterase [Verrucomicrobiota bacterium sgz303538]
MHRSRYQLAPGIILDARRAVWLEETETLAVADLHLGYAWAHRHSGQLMPVSAREDTLPRLAELVTDYQPRELALLGDIVHRAVPVDALSKELLELETNLGSQTELCWIIGNHDKQLSILLRESGVSAELLREHRTGTHLLVHGDASPEEAAADMETARASGGRVLLGHEHPAVSLSDGVTTTLKCPCFLVQADIIVLPAFSPWAAGSDVRRGKFLSSYPKKRSPRQVVAILGGKLLPVRL